MKVRVSKDWWNHYVREQYGKTQAEKEARAENIWSSPGRGWAETMQESKGQWLDVETEFIFEDQFNTKTARVMAKHIDAIQFTPEYANLEEYQVAVQKRYDKDWPGSIVKCAVLSHYIKEGFIKVVA